MIESGGRQDDRLSRLEQATRSAQAMVQSVAQQQGFGAGADGKRVGANTPVRKQRPPQRLHKVLSNRGQVGSTSGHIWPTPDCAHTLWIRHCGAAEEHAQVRSRLARLRGADGGAPARACKRARARAPCTLDRLAPRTTHGARAQPAPHCTHRRADTAATHVEGSAM